MIRLRAGETATFLMVASISCIASAQQMGGGLSSLSQNKPSTNSVDPALDSAANNRLAGLTVSGPVQLQGIDIWAGGVLSRNNPQKRSDARIEVLRYLSMYSPSPYEQLLVAHPATIVVRPCSDLVTHALVAPTSH